MCAQPRDQAAVPKSGYFPTTHWSVVLNAGVEAGGETAEAALEQLCQTYWYPLYLYVRREGYAEADAKDMVQGFIATLLKRQSLRDLSPAKGKFRSFLLVSLNHFLLDEADRARARKQGGGQPTISFDAADAEQRFKLEPVDAWSPDRLFERRWVLTILDQVLERLEAEFRADGHEDVFERIKPYLASGGAAPAYGAVAHELNKSEEAVKKAVQRMRQRYYKLFREVIAQTVHSREELEDEIRYLCRIMAEG